MRLLHQVGIKLLETCRHCDQPLPVSEKPKVELIV